MPREDITQHELTDDVLIRMVTDAIAWDRESHFREIHVDADEGIITLSGIVENEQEKSAAEVAASHVPGVTQVVNNIGVRSAVRMDDLRIAENVMRVLMEDTRVDARFIEVVVNDGVVILRGEVTTLPQKLAAIDDARSSYGVIDVIDRLTILPQENIPDHMLEEVVQNMLARMGNVDVSLLHAHVENGRVHLEGNVPFDVEKRQAEDAVRSVPGVNDVINDIQVAR